MPALPEVRDDGGDLGSRFAWLLLTHRLHADPTYADPTSFAAALTAAGGRASDADVLSWEAATELPPYDVVAAWERACGLADGWLATVCPFLASTLPGLEVPMLQADPPPDSPARVDELIASVSDVSAQPADWAELGQRLGAGAGPEPTAAEADRVARGLVNQLPRCVGVAYRQLNVAAQQLCRLPAVQDAVVAQVREHVRLGAVQQASDPVTLLSMIPTRAAAVLVLEMLERPSRTVLPLVVWVATRKQALGHFTDSERARLEVAVLTRWRSGARTTQRELAELISVLPGGFREVLTRAGAGDGPAMSGTSGAQIALEIAAAAAAAAPGDAPYDVDPLLARLVREALFHHQTERRHLASVLVEASPFATAVADQVVALLAAVDAGPLRYRAAALTCYVTGESHRMRLHRFVDDPQASVAIFATYALGRLRYAVTTDLALRRGLPTESTPTAQARLHALGMTGSPALSALASRSGGEEWQRRAAEWWLAGGPAIR